MPNIKRVVPAFDYQVCREIDLRYWAKTRSPFFPSLPFFPQAFQKSLKVGLLGSKGRFILSGFDSISNISLPDKDIVAVMTRYCMTLYNFESFFFLPFTTIISPQFTAKQKVCYFILHISRNSLPQFY